MVSFQFYTDDGCYSGGIRYILSFKCQDAGSADICAKIIVSTVEMCALFFVKHSNH